MSTQTRQELLERLTRKLRALDEETLARLDAALVSVTAPPAAVAAQGAPPTASQGLPAVTRSGHTRRWFLAGSVLGGTASLMTVATGGFVFWGRDQLRLLEAEAELLRLRGLLMLYEALEQVGLDAIATLGIEAVSALLAGTDSGARLLRSGTERAEQALYSFTSVVPTLRAGLESTEELIAAVSHQLLQLQQRIYAVVERASPLTSAMSGFFDRVLALVPDRFETPIRESLIQMGAVVNGVPELLTGVNRNLLSPLRQNWFGAQAEQQLESTLLEPINQGLLTPLQSHLDGVSALVAEWESRLAAPARAALSERQSIRMQIERYRQENQLA